MFNRVEKCLEEISQIKSEGGKVFFHSSDSDHMLDGLFESIHNAYSAIFESVEEIQEQFNERFWISPEYLYHATSKSNVNSIMEYGIVSDKFGKRKLMGGNRDRQNQRLIFTVTEDGIDKISRYGDVILKIDTKAMKLDGFIPNVSMEDDLAEYYDSDEDLDVNMSDFEEYGTFEETVILEVDKIPPKYVTVLTNYQEDEPELNWNTVLSSYEENDEINQFIKDNINDLDWTHLYGYNSFPKYIQNNKFVQERILELIEESVDLRKTSGAYNEQKFLSNLIDRYKFPLSLISKANI